MFEEVSQSSSLSSGLLSYVWRFPEASSTSHVLMWNLNVFPKVMCYNTGSVARKSQHRKFQARMASSHPLQHYRYGTVSWSSLSSTTKWQLNDVLSSFLLKKEMTYCLVSSHGLCFSGCVWRSQESLVKKRKICLARLIACPVTQALGLMLMTTTEEPASNGHERERTHKSNSAPVNCFMAFKGRKDKQVKIQP